MRQSRAVDPWRTFVPAASARLPIAVGEQVLSIGSCFAEVMGERLGACGFPIVRNPFGIVYNPSVIAQSLRSIMSGRTYRARDLFEHEGLLRNLDFHTSFARESGGAALRRMNASVRSARAALDSLDVLVVTFGTAFTWYWRQSGQPAANCHRLSEKLFDRRLVTTAEIVADWSALIGELRAQRPCLRVFFTISPIRHLRHNPVENSVSKAHLVAAVYELCRTVDATHYFPAYEIVLDELRDYRFYGRDRAHLSEEAEEYVWTRFTESCLNDRARACVTAWNAIHTAMGHRPRGTRDAVERFARSQLEMVNRVASEFPEIAFDTARLHFKRMVRS